MNTLTDSVSRNVLRLLALCGLMAPVSPLLGQTWTPTSAPVPNLHWQSIAVSADGSQVAAAATTPTYPYYGPIYTSADSGHSWVSNALSPKSWSGIASSADGIKLVAVAVSGPVYASTDSGHSWISSFSPAQFSCVASSADGTKLVAAAQNGAIYLSTNSGAAWTMASGTSGRLWRSAASSADGTKLVAVCQRSGAPGGSIYTSTDSGASWVSNNAPNLLWVAVASSADGNVLVAAPGGLNLSFGPLCVSTNSGTTWLSNGSPVLAWTAVAASADGRQLIASALAANGSTTFSNSLFTSTDFGATWTSNNVPAQNWSAVACSADGSKLVAATLYGGIWASESTPSPRLKVAPGDNQNLVLSWTVPSASLTLQESADLCSWSRVTNTPVLNLSNLHHEATLSPSNRRGFYRLAAP